MRQHWRRCCPLRRKQNGNQVVQHPGFFYDCSKFFWLSSFVRIKVLSRVFKTTLKINKVILKAFQILTRKVFKRLYGTSGLDYCFIFIIMFFNFLLSLLKTLFIQILNFLNRFFKFKVHYNKYFSTDITNFLHYKNVFVL